jgi:hypothetical protein
MYAYDTFDEDTRQDTPVLSVVSLWFGAGLVGITAVASIITFQNGGGSGAAAVTGMFRFILFALILASGVYLMWRTGSGSLFLAAMPLLINIFTLIIIQFVPFAAVWEEMRFQMNSSRYNRVVEMVESGQIQPDANGAARLPVPYRGVSRGGRILVENHGGVTSILFLATAQTGGGMAGYLYRSDGVLPRDEFGGNWRYVAEKRPSWFYCAKYE